MGKGGKGERREAGAETEGVRVQHNGAVPSPLQPFGASFTSTPAGVALDLNSDPPPPRLSIQNTA